MGEGNYVKHQCAYCLNTAFLRDSDPLKSTWVTVTHTNADGSTSEYELDQQHSAEYATMAQRHDTELAVWLKQGQKGESNE